jgi:hypothetical protein
MRVRSLLVLGAAVAVLVHGIAGHELPLSGHEGDMAGAAMGLCLLLVTAAGLWPVRRDEGATRPAVPTALDAPAPAPAPSRIDARARASPPVLQRFRN